jgi:DNA polymerase-3 subunit beta
MKFNVAGKTLKQHLGAVGKVVNPKNALSILENFLLTVNDGSLTITGSDQENVVVTTVEIADVEGEGSIAVPAKRLMDIMKEIPDQGLQFNINDTTFQVEIKYLNGHFSFMGYSGNEYPKQKERENDAFEVTVNAEVLSSGIEQTAYAVSSDPIRPVMTGICMDFKTDALVFVASDTHKLVKCEFYNVHPGIETRFVLPSKSASLLRGLLDKTESDVKITIDSKGAVFEFDSFKVSTLFITGLYPNYEKVFPHSNPFKMEVDKAAFISAMRRMALTVNQGSKLVKFNIQPEEVLISAEDLDYSSSGDEHVPCNYDGNPMNVGFNADYVLEVTNNLKSDSIVFLLSDPVRPGIVAPSEQPEGMNVVVLLMTMQLVG